MNADEGIHHRDAEDTEVALIPKVYRDTADHGVDNGKTVPRHGDLSLWRHRQG